MKKKKMSKLELFTLKIWLSCMIREKWIKNKIILFIEGKLLLSEIQEINNIIIADFLFTKFKKNF